MSKPTEHTFRTTIPIYETSLYLVVSDDVPEYYRANVGEDRGRPPVAFTAWIGGRLCVVVAPNATVGILAHEVVHASAEILDHHGSKWGSKNQEPVCYLVSWLMDWIYRRLQSQENKSKNKCSIKTKV